ncbi:MAG: PH domain-containing protein [Lachnospiraceae bacterium]|nr:PH domain-containing protein [Lachnospiraceae bacterium]
MATYVERKRWLFLGLPFTFTKYTLNEEKLIRNMGFFKTKEDTCYLYKIIDTKLERTLIERMFGLGTVICYTGDVTDKVIKLIHIKHSKDIKEYLVDQSEEMRRKRRTLNTLSLTQGMSDIDDADLED